MDIKELKNLIKNSSTLLIIENGEPAFVILGYENYKNLMSEKEKGEVRINHVSLEESISSIPDSELVEKLNQEILALKNQIETEEKQLFSPGSEEKSDISE